MSDPSPLAGEGGPRSGSDEGSRPCFNHEPPLAIKPLDRLRSLAKRMRSDPVSTERTPWRLLRHRRLGDLKFRRQVPIGRFVDFVCMRHRIIVEADGYRHEIKIDHDLARDAWPSKQGFRVLRFAKRVIEGKPHIVLAAVVDASRSEAERLRDPSSDSFAATFSRKGRRD